MTSNIKKNPIKFLDVSKFKYKAPDPSTLDNRWVPVKAIHQVVEHNMDMQDCYLPVHFLDLVDSMPFRSFTVEGDEE